MNRGYRSAARRLRTWVMSGSLFLLGGCSVLTDQQMTQVLTSFVSTGINAVLTNAIAALFAGPPAA